MLFLEWPAQYLREWKAVKKKKEKKKKIPSVNDLFSRCVMAVANASDIWKLLDLGIWFKLGLTEEPGD